MRITNLRLNLTPEVKRLEIRGRRDILSKVLEGRFVTMFKGRGMEFTGYRAYSYGDDASMIDWPASLRARETLVKEFETYRNLSVYILVDVSDSMLFSSTRNNKLKAEYAAELASSMAYAILKTNNGVGLSMMADHLITRAYPDIGQAMIRRINKDLANPLHYGGTFDFPKVVRELKAFYKDRGILVIISDFIGMTDGWERYLATLRSQFDIIGIMIRDRRDNELPSVMGQVRIQDPSTSETLLIDPHQYRALFAQENARQSATLMRAFRKSSFLSLSTDENYDEKLIEFFRMRNTAMGG